MQGPSRRFCVAPMMDWTDLHCLDWTDRHCRYFHRQLTRDALLYTEMVTAQAVLHGDRERLLGFDEAEHPVALQLGGSDPLLLAKAASIGAGFGYDEINLNCGCPSDRVQSGRFGACLMAEPELVATLFAAMQEAVDVPVTVKCRIGIDDQDTEADFDRFIETVAAAGCRTFIVHARKAWLKGLSPKENREVPPLDCDRVARLKARRADLEIVLNGGIGTMDEVRTHLSTFDGVMLGRAAYQTPYILSGVDRELFEGTRELPSRADAIEGLLPHVDMHVASGGRLNNIARHILGLYHGRPRGRAFRRHLAENAVQDGAGSAVLRQAVAIAEGDAMGAMVSAGQ